MGKSILFRLFGLGGIPGRLRPVLESEQIVVADEGLRGWIITRRFKGPAKRYFHRRTGFAGCLVLTKKRLVCFNFRKRQINIAVDDPRMSELVVGMPAKDVLSIALESSVFRDDWAGEIEFRFKTQKAAEFFEALTASGARGENVRTDQ